MNGTRFYHRRLGSRWPNGRSWMVRPRNPEKCGWVTICLVDTDVSNVFLAGAAWCAPGDSFSRKTGRLIAEGRAKSPKSGLRVYTDGLVNTLLTMSRNPLASSFPRWARNSVALVKGDPATVSNEAAQ